MKVSSLNDEIGSRRFLWSITGAGGFIGSHLAATILRLGQDVIGVDDLSTGFRRNIEHLLSISREPSSGSFKFVEGSIVDLATCRTACKDAEVVLHQAALGSIPRSIEDPERTHSANATGTLNMLLAARDAGSRRFVYASSSSVYGDEQNLPKLEDRVGKPLAPYASSKIVGEHYARNFAQLFGLETLGLRYFNVFGPRQDPHGAYAAVIPKWITTLAARQAIDINGDGETSRDFCYVANVVQANLLAAMEPSYNVNESVFNIALGGRTTLNQLHAYIVDLLSEHGIRDLPAPNFRPARKGDIQHSEADIARASRVLGYAPSHDVVSGLRETVNWFLDRTSS